MEGVQSDVSQALRLMLMLNVPATFGLIALAGPIVELLVEYRQRQCDQHAPASPRRSWAMRPGWSATRR